MEVGNGRVDRIRLFEALCRDHDRADSARGGVSLHLEVRRHRPAAALRQVDPGVGWRGALSEVEGGCGGIRQRWRGFK